MVNNDIQNSIQFYISHCQTLISLIDHVKMSNDAKNKLGASMLSIGAGVIAEDLFGTREAGKLGRSFANNYLKQQQRQQIETTLKDYQGKFDFLYEQIKGFVNTISTQRRGLTKDGNSYVLLEKLAGVQSSSRLRSKVAKTIAYLHWLQAQPLIHNSEVVQYLASISKEEQPSPYDILHNLESKLRSLIEKRLSRLSHNWWLERVPNDVRQNAELRKAKNERPMPWYDQKDDPLISFVDFSDYIKIIRKGDNWKQTFKEVFKDEEWISAKLKEIEPIRNAIAHTRRVTKDERKRLDLDAKDIIRAIRECP